MLTTDTRLQPNALQRFATEHPRDRHAPHNGRRAPGMVGMGMADQQRIQAAYAQLLQGRQHYPLPRVVLTFGRPGVVKQAVMTGTQQHCHPLADVQLPDFHLPRRHRLSGHPQRQQHGPAQPAQGHATGQQHQQRTQAHH
ncbi:hypothetical protein D3C81_1534300 [compost metagenome]